MTLTKTITVTLSLLLLVSIDCQRQSWGGPLEEKLMREFGALYPESSESGDLTFKKIKELVDQKADVNVRNAKGDTLLITAALAGDPEVAELLIKGGADVNLKSSKDGLTPLMIATYNGDMEIIDLLLNNKADVNAVNQEGQTALFLAVERGDLDVAKKLCEKGVDVNYRDPKQGLTALLLAASLGDLDMAQVLVGAKAKVDVADSDGNTPLMIASANDDAEMVNWLIAKGCRGQHKRGLQRYYSANGCRG